MSSFCTPFWNEMTPVLPRRGLGIPQLDAEHDQIDRPDRPRIIGRLHGRQVKRFVRALDAQPVLAHGGEMRPPRDEGDVGAAPRQPRPEVAADPARPHDGYAHEYLLMPMDLTFLTSSRRARKGRSNAKPHWIHSVAG
jgi:hypothetical protein